MTKKPRCALPFYFFRNTAADRLSHARLYWRFFEFEEAGVRHANPRETINSSTIAGPLPYLNHLGLSVAACRLESTVGDRKRGRAPGRRRFPR